MRKFAVGDYVQVNRAGCELLQYPYNVPPYDDGVVVNSNYALEPTWLRVDWGDRTGVYKQRYLERTERLCLRGNELTLEDTDTSI
jgi:hypothetical protein